MAYGTFRMFKCKLMMNTKVWEKLRSVYVCNFLLLNVLILTSGVLGFFFPACKEYWMEYIYSKMEVIL